MNAYEKLLAARADGRATAKDYIGRLFYNFTEMHGDRRFGDDPAVIAGIGMLGRIPVTVIGIEKGHGTKERVARNFGSAHPEGYRKALRQMRLAEKFGRPVVCFVDTSGAYCGIGAEERGQGQAIAENLTELMGLRVPVISILIGEGGSGGALALAVADEVWMLENAVYSVISPEGCASILWKDPARVRDAAEYLKITAQDLLALHVIDRIVPEGLGFSKTCAFLKIQLIRTLTHSRELGAEELLNLRYERFRKIGNFEN
ncbi:acetyl-CoA carboxylase carboxyltransferase subunit alpha [Caproiciproducens sp. NJN-50]|uniref:acetyl-CoA carboxylase carboxyltransferase subunit alpha n=1 Tax=Acutalibacteraceae TaxID=3082771 RepID=UPI000FFE096A|nr:MULTISPECIES: acetyl-CoA carboxylase carboxyltransferase subunit alpha [Acutalibacteraceae]QAT49365.1 acetyl-CoA carboxylase carboxyltransferase subunit alpha [Caproiciproducens sp. NJN-50]